jgi:hypothetical protein
MRIIYNKCSLRDGQWNIPLYGTKHNVHRPHHSQLQTEQDAKVISVCKILILKINNRIILTLKIQ